MAGGGGVLGRVDNLFFGILAILYLAKIVILPKFHAYIFPTISQLAYTVRKVWRISLYMTDDATVHCTAAQCDDLNIEGNVRKLVT